MEGEVYFNAINASGSVTSLVHVNGGTRFPGDPFRGITRNIKKSLQISGLLVPAFVLTSRSGTGINQAITRVAGMKWVDIVNTCCDHGHG